MVSCGAPVAPSEAAIVSGHPLQPLVDAADVGAVLLVPAGAWSGPVRIDKARADETSGVISLWTLEGCKPRQNCDIGTGRAVKKLAK